MSAEEEKVRKEFNLPSYVYLTDLNKFNKDFNTWTIFTIADSLSKRYTKIISNAFKTTCDVIKGDSSKSGELSSEVLFTIEYTVQGSGIYDFMGQDFNIILGLSSAHINIRTSEVSMSDGSSDSIAVIAVTYDYKKADRIDINRTKALLASYSGVIAHLMVPKILEYLNNINAYIGEVKFSYDEKKYEIDGHISCIYV